MGSIFRPPSPPPLPPVQAPPPAPSSEISDAEKAQIKKDVERKRKGRRSTILTGPLGIQEDQDDATNSLLGKK